MYLIHFFYIRTLSDITIMKQLTNVILLPLLLLSSGLFAQLDVNNISLEVGYGYNGAIGPYNKNYNSNFSGTPVAEDN